MEEEIGLRNWPETLEEGLQETFYQLYFPKLVASIYPIPLAFLHYEVNTPPLVSGICASFPWIWAGLWSEKKWCCVTSEAVRTGETASSRDRCSLSEAHALREPSGHMDRPHVGILMIAITEVPDNSGIHSQHEVTSLRRFQPLAFGLPHLTLSEAEISPPPLNSTQIANSWTKLCCYLKHLNFAIFFL